MKLLVDARVGWGHGIGRVVANIVPRMAALRPDWRIGVLVGPADVPVAEAGFAGHGNLSVVACPVEPFSLAEQVRLQGYARDADLTWFTNYWVPLGWRGRFVATVHDMLHLIPAYFPASPAKRLLARRTFHKLRRDAAGLMFVSRFTEREFAAMIGPPRRAAVVRLGGDHLHYGTLRPSSERSRRLLVVAAAKKHKNFALLADAWRRAEIPDHWTLTVVTPGSALRSSIDVEALVTGAGRTEVLRGVSDADLAALYADSAIVLMPSLYEGFGLPLLEGMLAGAFCISANAGAMVEVAEGSFVQFADGADPAGWAGCIEATCALVDRQAPELASLLEHNAVQARRFTWHRSAEEVVTLIADAAAT